MLLQLKRDHFQPCGRHTQIQKSADKRRSRFFHFVLRNIVLYQLMYNIRQKNLQYCTYIVRQKWMQHEAQDLVPFEY